MDGVPVDNATTLHTHAATQKSVVQLIPKVFNQIFSFACLADSVNGCVSHWLVSDIACEKLDRRIVEPRNGMFLLKWPLCFHDRQDTYRWHRQFRYIDLVRYNVSCKMPAATVTDQIQLFLAGYESLVLSKVLDSAESKCYSGLTTFMVDFSLNDENIACTTYQAIPFRAKDASKVTSGGVADETDHIHSHMCKYGEACSTSNTLFLGNWQLWAKTIIAVVNSCSSSLLHFVFTNDGFARHEYYNSHDNVSLPAQLFRELNFDKMLTEFDNLRTLYMPIEDYGEACKESAANGEKLEIWPLLRSMAPNFKALPKLRRIVIDDCHAIANRYPDNGRNAYRWRRPGCTFPDLPLSDTEVFVEVVEGKLRVEGNYVEGDYSGCLVFPHAIVATSYNIKLVICPFPESEGSPEHPTFCYLNDYSVNQHVSVDQCLKTVKNDAWVRERQHRLGVLNDMLELAHNSSGFVPAAKKAVIEVSIIDPFMEDDPVSDRIRVSNMLTTLFHKLETRQLGSSVERVVIKEVRDLFNDVSSKKANHPWSWGVMRQLLPFFTAKNANDHVLNTVRLDMILRSRLESTTFSGKFDEWLTKAAENEVTEKLLLSEQYIFPHITLTLLEDLCVEAREIAVVQDPAAWTDVIEGQMLQKIRLFVRDAVNSHTRRGMCLSMYQRLKRVNFEFEISLDFDGRISDKFLLKRIELLLQSRAAKFEQRIVHEVFAEELIKESSIESFGWIDVSATPPVPYLPFSALHSISSSIKISVW